MKLTGTGTVRAAPDAVWAALGDPRVLILAVPGLDQIDFAGDGTCRFMLTATIAAVSGSYAGEASVAGRPEPGVRVLRVSATGVKGKVAADVTIRLAATANGETELSYAADAEVEGAIAGIGQRMLASIARRIATGAINGLGSALAEPAAAAAPAASAAQAAETPGGGQRPDMSSGRTAIEPTRRGIGLLGERVPALGSPAPAVRTGLVAGAAAAVAAIVVGALVRKRRSRP
jgi:uncharacterized protein